MELDERMVEALDSIADAFQQWVKLEQARFEREYPIRTEPTDATVTVPKTEEERLRELQSATPEEIEEYVGPRERQFVIDGPPASPEKPASKPRRPKKKIPAQAPRGKRG